MECIVALLFELTHETMQIRQRVVKCFEFLRITTAAVIIAFAPHADEAVAGLVGPTPYLQASDSPFSAFTFNYFHLEDFEDNLFNAPGVTKSAGHIIGPGSAVDSVDADDGAIDGSGNGGRSLFVVGSTLTFTFDPVALGGLPTHAGFVRTDGGNAALGTVVSLEAFGPGMVSLGTVGPAPFGDGISNGTTAEDRFFGWSDPNGILAIRMSSGTFEVDHLQYGRATVVPEPGGYMLVSVLVAVLGILRLRGCAPLVNLINRAKLLRILSAAMITATLAAVVHAGPSQPGSGGFLVVGSFDTDQVLRYDAGTGGFVDEFVGRRNNGLNQPWGLVFGPHDGNLYVSTGHFQGPGQLKAVLRYDGATGAFIDEFIARGQLTQPHAITFGPDGHFYVGDRLLHDSSGARGEGGRIVRFDGHSGAFIDEFVPLHSGGLDHPLAHVFGPDANRDGELDLYVTDEEHGNIVHYDGITGAFLGEFVPKGSGGLVLPLGLTFGPDGNLYVSDASGLDSGPILRFQGPSGPTPGAFMDAFVPSGTGGLLSPSGLLFGPDRNGDGQQDLYVAGAEIAPSFYVTMNQSSSVKVYDGVTGDYLDDFIELGSGGLDGPILMSFTETDPVTLNYLGGPARHAVAPGVPEPSGLMLASLSAAGLTIYYRRRPIAHFASC
jgi:DNA-binding beta-propeller fold protein YncE